MPLLQAYSRPELLEPAADAPFVVAIAGEGPSARLHTGGFVSTSRAWAILAAPFVDDPCNGLGPESCSQAMALRALHKAYGQHLLPRDGQFTLITTNIDVAELLIRWQDGHPSLPKWYTREGSNSTLRKVQRSVERIGRRMTVQCLPVAALPPAAEAARMLAFIGLRYLRGEISPTDQHFEGQLALREAGL